MKGWGLPRTILPAAGLESGWKPPRVPHRCKRRQHPDFQTSGRSGAHLGRSARISVVPGMHSEKSHPKNDSQARFHSRRKLKKSYDRTGKAPGTIPAEHRHTPTLVPGPGVTLRLLLCSPGRPATAEGSVAPARAPSHDLHDSTPCLHFSILDYDRNINFSFYTEQHV